MNWKMMQWWAALTPINKLITGLGIALIVLSSVVGVLWRQGKKDNSNLSAQLQNCNQEKVNITERLKDQVINLQQANQDYERKELERLRAQNEYRDSVNNMYLLTRRKAEKVMENAKK